MNRCWHLCMAILLGMGSSLTTAADLTIAVHPERVTANRRNFDDADALEQYVQSMAPRGVRVQACGVDATATWELVIYRLRQWPLEPAVTEANDPACSRDASVTPVRYVPRTALRDQAKDPAVALFWREMMP